MVVYMVFITCFLGDLLAEVSCFLAEDQLIIISLKNFELDQFHFKSELFNFI